MSDTKEDIAKLYEQHLSSESEKYNNEFYGKPVEGVESIDSQYQSLARRTDPNEFAALNQTGWDKTGNILARGTNTFVGGVLGTVGMLYDIPASTFKAITGDGNEGWDYFMNEGINANIAKLQEDINKEVPLYQTYKDSQTPFTMQNIADGITQGLAFIGSAVAGGELTTMLSGANKINQTTRAARLALGESKLGKVLNSTAALKTGNVAKTIGGAIYNRAFESVLEAKGTGEELRQQLEAENEDSYNQTGAFKYTDEDISNRVRQAEKLNFGFNLALGLIDAYQNAKIFKNFNTDIGRAASNKLDETFESVINNKNISWYNPKKIAALTGKYGKKVGALTTTGISEGVEELAQYSSNKLSQDLATNNYTQSDWENLPNLFKNILDKMGEDITTDKEAQFSALIGSLVGTPMGFIANRQEEANNKILEAQRKVAQQSLIEKTALSNLYKIRNATTSKERVEGEIGLRYANNKSFQTDVIDQIQSDNFESYIKSLEDKSNTTQEELDQMGIQPSYDEFGNTVTPQSIVKNAISDAKELKKIYDNVNLNFAKESTQTKKNIASTIADIDYTDKKIGIVQSKISDIKNKLVTRLTNDVDFAKESFKDVKSKDKGDVSFFLEGNTVNANIEDLNINPKEKEEYIKLQEELKQLKTLKQEFTDTYNKYKDPNFIIKQEEKAAENTQNLEEKKGEIKEEPTIEPNVQSETVSKPFQTVSQESDNIPSIDDLTLSTAPNIDDSEPPVNNVTDIGEPPKVSNKVTDSKGRSFDVLGTIKYGDSKEYKSDNNVDSLGSSIIKGDTLIKVQLSTGKGEVKYIKESDFSRYFNNVFIEDNSPKPEELNTNQQDINQMMFINEFDSKLDILYVGDKQPLDYNQLIKLNVRGKNKPKTTIKFEEVFTDKGFKQLQPVLYVDNVPTSTIRFIEKGVNKKEAHLKWIDNTSKLMKQKGLKEIEIPLTIFTELRTKGVGLNVIDNELLNKLNESKPRFVRVIGGDIRLTNEGSLIDVDNKNDIKSGETGIVFQLHNSQGNPKTIFLGTVLPQMKDSKIYTERINEVFNGLKEAKDSKVLDDWKLALKDLWQLVRRDYPDLNVPLMSKQGNLFTVEFNPAKAGEKTTKSMSLDKFKSMILDAVPNVAIENENTNDMLNILYQEGLLKTNINKENPFFLNDVYVNKNNITSIINTTTPVKIEPLEQPVNTTNEPIIEANEPSTSEPIAGEPNKVVNDDVFLKILDITNSNENQDFTNDLNDNFKGNLRDKILLKLSKIDKNIVNQVLEQLNKLASSNEFRRTKDMKVKESLVDDIFKCY